MTSKLSAGRLVRNGSVRLLVLLLFGGRKIPELMRGVGQGMKEFKKATSEDGDDDDVVDDTAETKKIKDGGK